MGINRLSLAAHGEQTGKEQEVRRKEPKEEPKEEPADQVGSGGVLDQGEGVDTHRTLSIMGSEL